MRYSLEVTHWIIWFLIFSYLLLNLPRKELDKHNLDFRKAAGKEGLGREHWPGLPCNLLMPLKSLLLGIREVSS